MPSAASLSSDSGRFFALFVGESGSGKTVAECSFPGPIDIDDFDGRIRGILGASWITAEMKSKISYDFYPPKLSTMAGEQPNYVKLNKKLESLMIQCQSRTCPYQTKVLDSLTSQCYALICDAIPMTHESSKGKSIGQIQMAGPEDYGFESQGTSNVLAFLRSLAIPNVIVSAHMVDRFGKADPNNAFSESIVIGKKLSIRDKIGTNSLIYFDHVFEFFRRGNKYFVKFRDGELARTSYSELPAGEHDITGKNFYEFMMKFLKKPEIQSASPASS